MSLPAPAPRGCPPFPPLCPEPVSSSLLLVPFATPMVLPVLLHPSSSSIPLRGCCPIIGWWPGSEGPALPSSALADAHHLPFCPADPIAKDPARIGTSAGLSASNTPVSSSSMLAGERWDSGRGPPRPPTQGRASSPALGSPPDPLPLSPAQVLPRCPRPSPSAAWLHRPSSPLPTLWARRSPPQPACNPELTSQPPAFCSAEAGAAPAFCPPA